MDSMKVSGLVSGPVPGLVLARVDPAVAMVVAPVAAVPAVVAPAVAVPKVAVPKVAVPRAAVVVAVVAVAAGTSAGCCWPACSTARPTATS